MFDDRSPIYRQIADQVKADVVSGTLDGDKQVMSTNQYAAYYRINPATVAKAFQQLVDEQVFGALLKYGRTGSVSANPEGMGELPVTDDQLKLLKASLGRHAPGGKVLPYSDAFAMAHKEFNKAAGLTLGEQQFWQSVVKALGSKRRPPPPRKKATKKDDDDE